MLRFWLFTCLLGLSLLQAQRAPYQMQWQKDAPVFGVGLGLSLGGKIWSDKLPPLTTTQLALLNVNNIPKIDRWVTQQWSLTAKKQSDILIFTSIAAPSLLLLDKDIRKDAPVIGAVYAQTFLLNYGLTALTKCAVHRTRPFVYNPNVGIDRKLESDARMSFFSGHTSTAASMSFMAAQIYADYHPESKALPYVWGAAAAIPALTGYMRVRAGKHFLTDVLTGYLVGTAVGLIVPRLHRANR